MDDEPDFVASARGLSEAPLRVRFFPFDVTLNMLVLRFPPRLLFSLFNQTFRGPKLLISAVEDAEILRNMFQQRFAPHLIDPIFQRFRPRFGVDERRVYLRWLTENCPEGVSQDDYDEFVMLCDHTINEWQCRRNREIQILSGIRLLSYIIVRSIQILILISICRAALHDNYFTVVGEGLGLLGVMLICVGAARTLTP